MRTKAGPIEAMTRETVAWLNESRTCSARLESGPWDNACAIDSLCEFMNALNHE